MNRSALLFALLLALPGVAGGRKNTDDQAIAYPDEEETPSRSSSRRAPRQHDDDVREESEEEEADRKDRARILASADDPNIGLVGELVGGLMLLEASRGNSVDARFAWGLRFSWEYSRLIFSEEWWRERLFADVTWVYAANQDGTKQVFADSNYHYFSVAPALAFPFTTGSAFAMYVQLGAGMVYEATSLHVDTVETRIGGIKPLFQYGLGLRGRPAITEDQSLRLSFRLEVTRLQRGYMVDTLLALGAGLTF